MGRLGFLAVATAGALASALGAVAPAQAAVTTQVTALHVPTVVDYENPSTGDVVRAHLVDPVGITPGEVTDEGYGGLTYVCSNFAGEGFNFCGLSEGHLVSGTAQDGEWEFGIAGGASVYRGFEINLLHVARLDGTRADIDLRTLGFPITYRTISRWGIFFDQMSPSTTQTTTLGYGQSMTIRGRLYFVDEVAARHPVANREITIRQKYAHDPSVDGTEPIIGTTTTAADGTFSVTVRPQRHAFRIYLMVPEGTTADGVRLQDGIIYTGIVDVTVRIAVQTKPTSLKAGTIGYVRGRVTPLLSGHPVVYLQRYRSGGWRNVSTAVIWGSAYTLAAQPPTKGNHWYRVYQPGDATHLANVTPEFMITGT